MEYQAVSSSVVNIVNPHAKDSSSASSARKSGKYQHYLPEICAKIGKYDSENGNSKAINHFKGELQTLKESTVRMFKQGYGKKLREEKRNENAVAEVVAIPHDTRGRPRYQWLRDMTS